MEKAVQVKQAKDKIKTGTRLTDLIIKAGGLWVRDQINKMKQVEVPALTLSFPHKVMRNYWSAFWGGHQLPLRFVVNEEVCKAAFVGRLSFAVTFIIADAVLLVGKFGAWLLRKMVPGLLAWHVLIVAGGVIGFLGWVLPRFLERMNFMTAIEQTKTMEALSDVDLTGMVLQVPEVGLDVGWLALIPLVGMIALVPFSVVRFKRWRGFKSVLKKKSKPIIGDDDSHE